MKILVTGSQGFLGKNLLFRLRERGFFVLEYARGDSCESLKQHLENSDVVVHLAGVNRPKDISDFKTGNSDLTREICSILRSLDLKRPIIYASSIQVELDNAYGQSKKISEEIIDHYSISRGVVCKSYRFPNIFGKWSRPNYNSAVATFCHSVANGLPYVIHDRSSPLQLIYVDDVVDLILSAIERLRDGLPAPEIENGYKTTVGEVADIIESFGKFSDSLELGSVGKGLRRALYSTYVSFLPTSKFGVQLKKHTDNRGDFVEMIRTPDCGQFSYFTAHPGVTRGGHYHHSKTEKFLVIQGDAKFKFRNLLTSEQFELVTNSKSAVIVDTIPGWVHDITNIGKELLIVALWANEKFDRDRPDTITAEV